MNETIELTVIGMTCDHCVRSITSAVNEVPGVSKTIVDLEGGRATVEGDDLDAERIIAAIEEEGYEAAVRR
jgi:copper chaperone